VTFSDATHPQALGHAPLCSQHGPARSEPDTIGVPRDDAAGRHVVGRPVQRADPRTSGTGAGV
jgi:hypothetical protein